VGRHSWGVLVWAGAAVVRLVLVALPGHPVDVGAFHAWAARLAEVGPRAFYAPGVFVDYLPGYLLVLWPLGLLVRSFPFLAPEVLKLPPAVADFAVAYWLRRLGGPRGGLAAAAYLWNPAVLLAGPWWGQAESVAVAWLVGSAWAWHQARPGWAGLLFALGALTKPQYAAAGVVLLLGLAQGWPGVRVVAGTAGSFLATVVGCGFLFGLWPWDLVRLALGAAATYPYGSVNALNLWYLLGWNWKPDPTGALGLPAGVWGTMLALAAVAWAGARVAGRGEVGLAALGAAAASASVFAFATRMHERYLFPAVPFVLLAWSWKRARSWLWAAASGVLLCNLVYGFAYLANFPEYATPLWKAVWAGFRWPLPQAVCVLSVGLAVACLGFVGAAGKRGGAAPVPWGRPRGS
jgi:dolichyl-phosphate-mannose-protein mannosyltransferase